MLLDDKTKKAVKKQLDGLNNPVEIVVFTQEFECQYCKDTRSLMEEVGELSEKLTVSVYDFQADKDKAAALEIARIPAVAVIGKKDYGIRYYGVPAGYEFSAFLEDIKMVSTGESDLADSTKQFLDDLKQDVHLQVFVTPTCPYCPSAVSLAHKLAFYSDRVKADMVETSEFPEMAVKYGVMGVPRTVINEDYFQEGAAPEGMIVGKIKEAVG